MMDSYEWFPEYADDLFFQAACTSGEAGELVNKVKKVMRGSAKYADIEHQIAEEAMDVFIYLMNVFGILEVDVMELYNAKRRANEARFGDSASTSGRGVRGEVPGEDREGPGEVRSV
jgi:NTP pyrophosphatase (non-canonical NTP hydrolase)